MAFDTSTVLTLIKHDTSQAEAAVKRLRGVERDRAKAMLDDLENQNRGLESQLATFAKVSAAVGAVIGLYKTGQLAARAYLEDVRLEAAAAGANIDKLREATQGLVETDTLLKFAGQAQAGVWKLNQQEMETTLQFANAMRFTMGAELEPTVQKLSESLAKGSTRALKEFGIETKDKTQALAEMRKVVAALGGQTTQTGDEFERAGVEWTNAVDDLQGAFGKLVVEMGPVVSEMAKIVSATQRLVDLYGQLPDFTKGLLSEGTQEGLKQMFKFSLLGALSEMSQEKVDLFPRARQQPIGPPNPNAGPGNWTLPWDLTPEERMRMIQAPRGPDPFQKITPGGAKVGDLVDVPAKLKVSTVEVDVAELQRELSAMWEGVKGVATALPSALTDTAKYAAGWRELADETDEARRFLDEWNEASKRAQPQLDAAIAAAERAQVLATQMKNRTILETLFGTPGEINLMQTSLQQAGAAFNVVAQAGGAAMDAWITGQKSLGEAFEDAIGQGLRALAVQATVEALKHTAFGFGALAFGPIMGPTAAQHFAAAGMFAGVAVAAGAGARAMGAGASAGAGASSTAPSSAAGSALTGRQTPQPTEERGGQTVIMLGSDILNLPELERRSLIYQAIQQGNVMDVRTDTIKRS